MEMHLFCYFIKDFQQIFLKKISFLFNKSRSRKNALFYIEYRKEESTSFGKGNSKPNSIRMKEIWEKKDSYQNKEKGTKKGKKR